MTSALEILQAERDAVETTISSQLSYLATLKTELAKTLKALAANEAFRDELQTAIVKIN
jgi:hypothetical protein